MQSQSVIVIGVCGSGKTTVGRALASRLGWDFYEADDVHAPVSIARMKAGIPLQDEDRTPWLAALHELIGACVVQRRPGVLACSALKDSYRATLSAGISGLTFVYLKADRDSTISRLANRRNHYMKPEMLDSQYDLQEPADALIVDAGLTVGQIVDEIIGSIDAPDR